MNPKGSKDSEDSQIENVKNSGEVLLHSSDLVNYYAPSVYELQFAMYQLR